MRRQIRKLIICAIFIGTVVLMYELIGSRVFEVDVLNAVIDDRNLVVGLYAASMLVLRLWLIVVAPVWLLHQTIIAVFTWRSCSRVVSHLKNKEE